MARNYAQLHHRIWADPDWRDLDAAPQLTYLMLLSQPTMNYAGVLPLTVRRWAATTAGRTPEDLDAALDQLHAARFIVLDRDTEEVLVRSFIRNDGLYANPRMLARALAEGLTAVSGEIRSALGVELLRLPATDKVDVPALVLDAVSILAPPPAAPPAAPPAPGGGAPLGPPPARSAGHPLGHPLPHPVAHPPGAGAGAVVGAGEVSSLDFQGESHLTERASSATAPRPPQCPRHPNGNAKAVACGGCRDAKAALDAWDRGRRLADSAEASATARRAAAAAAARSAECSLCGVDGRLDSGSVCQHNDLQAVAGPGIAATRASFLNRPRPKQAAVA